MFNRVRLLQMIFQASQCLVFWLITAKRVRFVALIATRFADVFFTLCEKSPNCMFRHDLTDVRIQTNDDEQLLNAVLVPYVAILAGYAGS